MGADRWGERGQSIFEFIVYLPFLLVFFNIFVSVSGSINGSINQLKATRGYFFHLLKGNPNLPSKNDLNELSVKSGINNVSMFPIGWREKESGQNNSFLTCYKIRPFVARDLNESCDKSSGAGQQETFLVRVGTMYTVCSGNYQSGPNGQFLNLGHPGDCALSDGP